jgi:hypothetical protein
MPDDLVTQRILGGLLLFHDALQAKHSRNQRVLGFTPKALNARPEGTLLLRTRRRNGLCQKRLWEAAAQRREPMRNVDLVRTAISFNCVG